MTDTVPVRVSDGDVWVDGEHLTRGDEVKIPAGVYERLPGSFDRVDGLEDTAVDSEADDAAVDNPEDKSNGDGDELTVDDLDPHPSDLTVEEIKDRIDNVDDIEILRTIWDAEANGKNRTTALEAIEAGVNDLEG